MSDRWWVNDDANGIGNDADNWSATEGGAGGAGIPTASDDIYFSDTSSSDDCSMVNVTACLSITTFGTDAYTGEMDFDTSSMTVGGNSGSVSIYCTLRIRGGSDFRCGDFIFESGSTLDADDGAHVWINSGLIDFSGATFTTNPSINMTVIGNSTFKNTAVGNTLDRFGNNVGIDIQFTDTSYVMGPLSYYYAFFGDMDINGEAVYLGAKAAGVWYEDNRMYISGAGNLYLEFLHGVTITATKPIDYVFTGTVHVGSIDQTTLISTKWGNAIAQISNLSAGSMTYNISSGTAIVKQLKIGSTGAGATVMGNNVTNPNINISEGINFNFENGLLTYTKGTGTISMVGSSGTYLVNFAGKVIENLSLNCAGSIKQIINDFTTDELNGSGGTLQSLYAGEPQTITSTAVGVMSNCTIKDIHMGAAERINAKNGCTNGGNCQGIVFEDTFFGMMSIPQITPVVVDDYLFRFRQDGNDVNQAVTGASIISGPGGKDSKAYGFDLADSEYIDISEYAALVAIGTGAFSWSFWTRYDGEMGGQGGIITDGTTASALTEWNILAAPGGNARYRTGGANETASGTYEDGEWHHWVFTSAGAGAGFKFWADGVGNDTGTMASYNFGTPSALLIGARSGPSTEFEGGIDELRFYNRVLTDAEIAELYAYKQDLWAPEDDTSILAYYSPSDCDSITQSSALVSQIDDKAASNDLTQATGADQPTTSTDTLSGNNLFTFDGTDYMKYSGLAIPASGNIMFIGVFTIGTISSIADSIFSYNSGTNDFQFQANHVSQFDGEIRYSGGTDLALTGGPFTGPDIWAVVFNWDTSTLAVYVNGTLDNSNSGYTAKLSNDGTQDLIWFANRAEDQMPVGKGGIFCVTEVVDDTTRKRYEGMLAWKYGLQGQLPGGHTYEDAPPLA